MSLIAHLLELSHGAVADGPSDLATATAFYIGLAIATTNPATGRRMCAQIEREFAEGSGELPEIVEVRLRAASRSLAEFLDHTIEEG